MNDKVIYTVILDDYDTLKEPLVITPGWDYKCYTNSSTMKSDTWKIEQVKLPSNRITNRFFKINIEEDYKTSIYVDGNIQINCNLDDFLAKYMTTDWLALEHPQRSDIYNEMLACVHLNKAEPEIMMQQLDGYQKDGFDVMNSGLYSCGLIARNHTSEVTDLSSDWWREVSTKCHRDQLSFPFVLSKYPEVKVCVAPFEVLKNEFIKTKHNLYFDKKELN